MNNQNSNRSCMSEWTETHWTETNWTEAEARFQRAKQALLDIQQQHCDAAHELLQARSQMRQLLEAVFLGTERGQGRLTEAAVKNGIESLGQALFSAGKGPGADVG